MIVSSGRDASFLGMNVSRVVAVIEAHDPLTWHGICIYVHRTFDRLFPERGGERRPTMALEDLRRSPMMSHLLDSLEKGKDIGHYGRLTFAMIAHRFLDRDELVTWLCKDKDCDETKAKALVQQVESRDYNPPSRQRILEWQAQQDFPICPTPDDPNACNPYRELQMPEDVLEDIEEFREEQFEAEEAHTR